MEDYRPEDFGKDEVEMIRVFNLQLEDARTYFVNVRKPILDRSYKLYIAYGGDRYRELSKKGKVWQANVSVPYIQAVVETLMPRILDARPEFTVQGRTSEDDLKGEKLQNLTDYNWEISKMDATAEQVTRASLVYGTGFLQVYWKKDIREYKFLETKDLGRKKYKWKKQKKVFYDAPACDWVDNYELWYDWRNVPRETKQFWFRRMILTEDSIKSRFTYVDKKRLKMALKRAGSADLEDYAKIRNEVKSDHELIVKGADGFSSSGLTNAIYQDTANSKTAMHEVFQWWRPFSDKFAVMVNGVPILKGGAMPIPYDCKEAMFIEIPYLKLMNEFEGMGLPMILEQPQIMLNMIKNQRLDAMTLNIHKMWIVNPLANIKKKDLVTRPFGIIYSVDPSGVKEVQFSDVKASAYKEEDLLKSDMRYASGVDDFSMGVSGGAGSATAVRHLRESTLERVRLFTNHLGSAYSEVMRYWLSMYRQFFTKKMFIRVVGDDGQKLWPIIEKDDLKGEFDFRAAVIPSIAGKNDIDKKQGMDLFQLLVSLPFVDPRKLTSKVLHSWNWSLDSVTKSEEEEEVPTMPGEEGMETMPEEGVMIEEERGMPSVGRGAGRIIPENIIRGAANSPLPSKGGFREASAPINLLRGPALPPTAGGLKGNLRGLNRGGKVNTNTKMSDRGTPESRLLGRAANIQR